MPTRDNALGADAFHASRNMPSKTVPMMREGRRKQARELKEDWPVMQATEKIWHDGELVPLDRTPWRRA